MTQTLQKQTDYNKDAELIKVVTDTIFPGATKSELAVFFFKCQSVGVHPLEKMIIPVIFEDKSHERRLSFISTIDFFRSMSEDAGDYDGMDEIEFIGETIDEYDGETYTHPDIAVCKVYRKDIGRPFIGVARWNEFYPGGKKGFMWRKMGYTMLGKCAEGQARRLAWPKKLNKLYTEEEMERGFQALAEGSTSRKPNVSPDDIEVTEVPETDYSGNLDNLKKPTDDEQRKGKLISDKQAYLLYKKCQENSVEIGAVAKAAKVENIFFITWAKRSKVNFNIMLNAVQNEPNRFHKYSQAAEAAKTAPKQNETVSDVMGQEEFEAQITSMANQAGISVEDALREACAVDRPDDVLPELQNKVLDFLQAKIDEGSKKK